MTSLTPVQLASSPPAATRQTPYRPTRLGAPQARERPSLQMAMNHIMPGKAAAERDSPAYHHLSSNPSRLACAKSIRNSNGSQVRRQRERSLHIPILSHVL